MENDLNLVNSKTTEILQENDNINVNVISKIVDSLDSTSAKDSLSANQGNVLNNKIDENTNEINNLNNKIDELTNNLFYKVGDTFEYNLDGIYNCAGCLTGAGSAVMFSIVLPKRLDNIKDFTVDRLVMAPRGNQGYLIGDGFGYNFKNDSSIDIKKYIPSTNTVTIRLTKNNGSVFNGANNTAATCTLNNIKLTFN